MATEKVTVRQKPTAKVTNLAIKKNGNQFEPSWKVPTIAKTVKKSTKKKKKKTITVETTYDPTFDWVDMEFYLVGSAGKLNTVEAKKANNWLADATALSKALKGNDKVWWRDKGVSWTGDPQAFVREKYYPVTSVRLSKAYAVVKGGNSAGWGPAFSSSPYVPTVPAKPTIATPELDDETQALSAKMTHVARLGSNADERYDSRWCITRQDNFSAAYKNEKVVQGWSTVTGTENTPSINMGDSLQLALNQWIRIKFKAFARGLAGDSATAEQSHIFAHPAQAAITGITVSSLDATGLVRIAVKTNSSTYRPVDKCVLERLKDTRYDTATAAAMSSDWETVEGQADDGNAKGFTDAVPDAITLVDPETGKFTGYRTWYRIATYHDNMPAMYSVPVQAASLYQVPPTAADDEVEIVSVELGADGTSATVNLQWDMDDSDATEVSWAVDEKAWRSTQQPSTFELPDATWADGSGPFTTSLTIHGLSQGVPVYIRARRHSDNVYGPYCDAVVTTPAVTPSNVQLSVPGYVARGHELAATWTFEGTEQQAWTLDYLAEDGSQVTLDSGEDAAGSAVIPASRIGDATSLLLRVGVMCGGSWAYSDAEGVEVKIVEPPVISVSAPSTLEAQPLTLNVQSSVGTAGLVCKAVSNGVSYQLPDKDAYQAAGQTIWSALVNPEWVEGVDGYTATVTLPEGLPFVDGSSFEFQAVPVDPSTGLTGEMATATVSVAWAHQAVAPDIESTVITADEEALSVSIVPVAGEGSAESDVCDIYRATPDGTYLIAESVPFGSTVTDRYAPYSDEDDQYYRIASRTVDGDVEWDDAYYDLPGDVLRLDWGRERSLELPYNLSVGDSRSKDFEERAHLDGAHAGYWNAGFTRKGSLDAEVERDAGDGQAALLNEMSEHAGAVFVRTPDGCAYQANVDLSGHDRSATSGVQSISLSATEVALTDEFRCAAEDVIFPGSDPMEQPEEDETEEES